MRIWYVHCHLIGRSSGVVGVTGVQHGSETFEVRADVVVGADGRYSLVSKLGGFQAAYHHHDFDLIWFTIPQPRGWSSTLHVSLGTAVRGLMLPKYPHHIQAGIALPAGEWRHWRSEGVAAVAERVRQFDPIFADFVRQTKLLELVRGLIGLPFRSSTSTVRVAVLDGNRGNT